MQHFQRSLVAPHLMPQICSKERVVVHICCGLVRLFLRLKRQSIKPPGVWNVEMRKLNK